MNDTHARVVVLTAYPPNYRLISDWAQQRGHEICLVVTPSADTGNRYGGDDSALLARLAEGPGLLVTGKLKAVAAPAIAALAPDLVISAAFPRRIPTEILKVPTYGALNLHPSALPAGRGMNPARLVYEGATTIGATLHRTEAEFDTGAVLSRRERPLPDELSGQSILTAWLEMFTEVLDEGAARALADEPGEPQDVSRASYPAVFTERELVIDVTDPAVVIRRKVAALNVLGPRARIELPACHATVRHVYPAPSQRPGAAPGQILATHPDGWTIQVADTALRVITVEQH